MPDDEPRSATPGHHKEKDATWSTTAQAVRGVICRPRLGKHSSAAFSQCFTVQNISALASFKKRKTTAAPNLF